MIMNETVQLHKLTKFLRYHLYLVITPYNSMIDTFCEISTKICFKNNNN